MRCRDEHKGILDTSLSRPRSTAGSLCLHASFPTAVDLCTPLMEAMPPAVPEHVVLVPPAILCACDLLLSLLFSLTCLRYLFLNLLQLPHPQKRRGGALLREHPVRSFSIAHDHLYVHLYGLDIFWSLASPFWQAQFLAQSLPVGLNDSENLTGDLSSQQKATACSFRPSGTSLPFLHLAWPNRA